MSRFSRTRVWLTLALGLVVLAVSVTVAAADMAGGGMLDAWRAEYAAGGDGEWRDEAGRAFQDLMLVSVVVAAPGALFTLMLGMPTVRRGTMGERWPVLLGMVAALGGLTWLLIRQVPYAAFGLP